MRSGLDEKSVSKPTIHVPWDSTNGFVPFPELMTEDELIRFLRIPEISKSENYHNVIENLKRMHDLPRIHICGRPLYPIEAIRKWVENRIITEK
jgi:hypothetical protein